MEGAWSLQESDRSGVFYEVQPPEILSLHLPKLTDDKFGHHGLEQALEHL